MFRAPNRQVCFCAHFTEVETSGKSSTGKNKARDMISPRHIRDTAVLFWLSLGDAAVMTVTSHDAERTLTDWMTLGELICIILSGPFTAMAT